MRLRMLIVHSVLFITSKEGHGSLAKFKRVHIVYTTLKNEEFPVSKKKMHRHESLESWAFGDGSNSPEKYPSSSANR